MNPKNWWLPFVLILGISLAGVTFIGYETYEKAPPIPDFVDEPGNTMLSRDRILEGQRVFHHYALMEYGSMFGDGALRGPDFTAQALHEMSEQMARYHQSKIADMPPEQQKLLQNGIRERLKTEIKTNRYDPATNRTVLNAAQVSAIGALETFYQNVFTNAEFHEVFKPAGYLTNPAEIRDLSGFSPRPFPPAPKGEFVPEQGSV